MPNCGYLKDYSIKVEQSQFVAELTPKGYIDVCNLVNNAFAGAKCVVREDSTSWIGEQVITISRSSIDQNKLEQFLGLLKNHLTIDTRLDEYHALGLYSEPPDWQHTWIGKLVNHAKYSQDQSAATKIADHLIRFIEAHPRYSRAKLIVSVPRSDTSSTWDLPSLITKHIASKLQKRRVTAQKVRMTKPQKDLSESGDINAYLENVKGSIRINTTMAGCAAILIDDTSRSCTTLEEAGRACRLAGAMEVLGLTAARDAKFTKGIWD